jgi:hypothetical protein
MLPHLLCTVTTTASDVDALNLEPEGLTDLSEVGVNLQSDSHVAGIANYESGISVGLEDSAGFGQDQVHVQEVATEHTRNADSLDRCLDAFDGGLWF